MTRASIHAVASAGHLIQVVFDHSSRISGLQLLIFIPCHTAQPSRSKKSYVANRSTSWKRRPKPCCFRALLKIREGHMSFCLNNFSRVSPLFPFKNPNQNRNPRNFDEKFEALIIIPQPVWMLDQQWTVVWLSFGALKVSSEPCRER